MLQRLILRNFIIIAGLSLSACNSGSTTTSNTAATNSILQLAQSDHSLVSVPELDDLYRDIPYNEEELYAMNSTAVENVFSQDPSPDAIAELNEIKAHAASMSPTHIQLIKQNSIQSVNQGRTHLYCYATAWLNKDGRRLPVSTNGAASNSFYLKSWALNLSSISSASRYVNFEVSIPNEPFDSDFPYLPSHSNHLPYFVKTANISELQNLCQTTLQAEIQVFLNSQYPGSSLKDVSLQDITIRGRNNSFSDDHPLLPLTVNGNSNKINTIVSLGDSLSDTDATSNFSMWMIPNRTTWFAGHFSNGWTWPEYAASQLNAIAYNEAWGAAGVNPQPVIDTLYFINNFQLWAGIFFPSLGQQTGYYYNNVTSQFPRNPDQTLYSVLIGGNDFVNYGESPGTVLNKVASAVDSLILTSNAKNIVILNLPDLTKAPAFSGYKANLKTIVAQSTAEYNSSLTTLIPLLNLQYPDVKITLFDTNSLFSRVINNPGNYGIINVTDTCLLAPDNAYLSPANKAANCDGYNYVFLDNLHPTTTVHRILGQAVADFVKQNYNF